MGLTALAMWMKQVGGRMGWLLKRLRPAGGSFLLRGSFFGAPKARGSPCVEAVCFALSVCAAAVTASRRPTGWGLFGNSFEIVHLLPGRISVLSTIAREQALLLTVKPTKHHSVHHINYT